MNFVDDEYLVAVAGRRVSGAVPKLPNVVDTVVGCTIDFQHIHGLGCRDLRAGWTCPARLRRGAFDTVESFGQDPRRGCFADPARPCEEIGMANAIRLDGILKGPDNGLLPNHLFENLGPEFSGNNLVFHSGVAAKLVRPGGYCGTLEDPLPLLPSGPGGVHGVQLHSPPQPDTERVGFEPTEEFPPHTLSKRA